MSRQNTIKATLKVLSILPYRALTKKQETSMENSSELNDTLHKHSKDSKQTHPTNLTPIIIKA